VMGVRQTSDVGQAARTLRTSKAKKSRAFCGAERSTLVALPLNRPRHPAAATICRAAVMGPAATPAPHIACSDVRWTSDQPGNASGFV
jgi:hypothetical protein